jgi:DNA-binding NarL/FixJ family response regulator
MIRYLGRDKNTVLWREWLGLVCAFLWFFGSMISYYEPFFTATWSEPLFMLLLCAGLMCSALLWGRYPKQLERALPYLTPAGAVCTGLIPFLPVFAGKAVFFASALLMTPLLCRRLYGVLRSAKDTNRSRTYISAVSVTIVLQMVWVFLPIPFTIKFPILSVFALLGLWRAEARLPAQETSPLPHSAAAWTPLRLLRIAAIFLLLVLLNIFNTLVHVQVLNGSLVENDLVSLLAWLAAPLAFLFFAYLSDHRKERLGFTIAMALILLGCFTALAPDSGILTAPLLISSEFGGTITEFCFLTMPLLFFTFSKRPKLIAVSGLIAHTVLSSLVSWTQDAWLPQSLLQEQINRPLIIFGAVCALVLTPLMFSVWRQQEEKTLMAALLGFKKHMEHESETSVQGTATKTIDPAQSWVSALDLLEGEHRIATLLCDGLTRAEIAERTGMSLSQISAHVHHIRVKLDAKPPVGHSAYVREAALRYGLTARETEVFGELLLGRSNTEISANLYIEAATVKTHVNKIMKKTGMSSRAELIAKAHADGNASLPVT